MPSLATLAILLLSFVATSAFAQSTKNVNVVNDETNPVIVTGTVEVTNPPVVVVASRFQLVGFTAVSYTGDMGGHFGVTRKCQLEFPGSRMCALDEIAATTTIPPGLSGNAWVHEPSNISAVVLAGNTNDSCGGWRLEDRSDAALLVGSDGSMITSTFCDASYPIACCAPVP